LSSSFGVISRLAEASIFSAGLNEGPIENYKKFMIKKKTVLGALYIFLMTVFIQTGKWKKIGQTIKFLF
jgi:hypothetical protein